MCVGDAGKLLTGNSRGDVSVKCVGRLLLCWMFDVHIRTGQTGLIVWRFFKNKNGKCDFQIFKFSLPS